MLATGLIVLGWMAQPNTRQVDSVVHCCPDAGLCGGQLPCNLSRLEANGSLMMNDE